MTDPWEKLAQAIIVQAAHDYRMARKHMAKPDLRYTAQNTISECEEFFRSNWFRHLTRVDGERLLRMLEEECA